jgi:3-oxoacyl-[acyl-carrier protein] reductase
LKKTVLITGASRGIGKATAIEFAKKGYNVVINYVSNDSAAKNLKKYLTENYDTDVMTCKCDISDEIKVKEMVKQVIDYFDKIDVLVNNAGIAIDTTFDDKTVENFRKTLDVNLIGPFIVSREVGKYMLEQKSGVIVNVSSDDAYEGYYEFSLDYDASKAGLINLTHNLSKYFAPYIRVNAVAPGWIETEMNSLLDKEQMNEIENKYYLKRLGRPEEVAKAIYFLASDDASYINNEVLRVDGGANHQ